MDASDRAVGREDADREEQWGWGLCREGVEECAERRGVDRVNGVPDEVGAEEWRRRVREGRRGRGGGGAEAPFAIEEEESAEAEDEAQESGG